MYKDYDVKELFEVLGGKSKYTRAYGKENLGEYPVYSASLGEPLTHISHFDYDGKFLSWATNGYAGNVQILDGKFSINADRGLLKPLDDDIHLEYVRKILQPKLREQAIGRIVDGKKNEYTKLSRTKVANTQIAIPVDDLGKVDYQAQDKILQRILSIESKQGDISSLIGYLNEATVQIALDGMKKSVALSDRQLFILGIGKRILKKDQLGEGVPAYSTNVNEPFGFIEESNLNDFSSPSLIWSIDGVFDWRYIPENTEFATTDHCGRLIIKAPDLNPKYIYHALKSTKDQYGFDRTYRSSLRNIRQVVSVDVPVDKNGGFDLDAQIVIAERYEKLEQAKGNILEQLEILSSVQVTLDNDLGEKQE